MTDVSTLEGAELDAAVARALGYNVCRGGLVAVLTDMQPIAGVPPSGPCVWEPSTSWAQGGPIIERERINITPVVVGGWAGMAEVGDDQFWEHGPTPLIAAMRAFVAAKGQP